MKNRQKTHEVVRSVGHSNRTLATFLRKLKENGVDTLIDVRSYPHSFRHPHFSQKPLHEALAREGITYLFYGDRLGGRENNRDYEGAVDEVVDMFRKGARVCLMCSEGDPKKCHRYTTLTPSLVERGITVEHIEYCKDEK